MTALAKEKEEKAGLQQENTELRGTLTEEKEANEALTKEKGELATALSQEKIDHGEESAAALTKEKEEIAVELTKERATNAGLLAELAALKKAAGGTRHDDGTTTEG